MRLAGAATLLRVAVLFAARGAASSSPEDAGSAHHSAAGRHDEQVLLPLLIEISDWIVSIGVGSNDLMLSCSSFWCTHMPSYIFINGNLARVLLAAHTITGNETYLHEGLNWCDSLVRAKHTITTSAPSVLATGYNHTTAAWWDSGYGTIYFGDTGTAHQALSMCAIKLPLGNERRAQYILAMREYGAFVQAGCVQQEALHIAEALASSLTELRNTYDLQAKAKVMRGLGLSQAAIQAAFDVDWPRQEHAAGPPVTLRGNKMSHMSRSECQTADTAPLPCPGGILRCPPAGRGWITESGAVGDGWVHGLTTLSPYSCSTATTGAGSFGALAAVLKGAADCDGPRTDCSREAADAEATSYKAALWLASTVNSTGAVKNYDYDGTVVPISSMGGIAYFTDGMLQAEILGLSKFNDSAAEAMRLVALDVAKRINSDGTWGVWGSADQMRSPRVATLLQWHERQFRSEPVVAQALQKFIAFVSSSKARYDPATGSCSVPQHGGFCFLNNTITTGMVGLAVADLLRFNSTFAWGLPPPSDL